MPHTDRIYADHAATTPLLPEVVESMLPWLRESFGNPSSLYLEGRQTKAAIDTARELISEALGCEFGELIFTSGGTEAANLAILGAALGNADSSRTRILMGASEHHCVLNTRQTLERLGYLVAYLPVDDLGRILVDRLADILAEDVLLIAAMDANNELGTFNDVATITEIAHQRGALVFCDAVQSFPGKGFIPLSRRRPESTPDLVSLAAHKLNGPKGAGALSIKAGTKMKPVMAGGGQEREMRAGTEDVAAIVGFAEAVFRHIRQQQAFHAAKAGARDAFSAKLASLEVEGLEPTSEPGARILPGHAHFRIGGISADTMLVLLDRMGVSAGSGAACSSGSIEASHVLLACGYSLEEAKEGLRFTFGVTSTESEAAEAANRVAAAAAQIRSSRAGD